MHICMRLFRPMGQEFFRIQNGKLARFAEIIWKHHEIATTLVRC